jgi:transposase
MHDYTIDLLCLNLLGKDIESLKTRLEQERLIIELKLKSKQQLCPVCQSEDLRFLGYTYKKIIHSISTHQPCLIRFHQRRYRCKICHKTFSESNPFTKPYGNLSLYTRVKILNYLKSGDHTFTATAEHYNVSVQTVLNLFDESVEAHRRRLPKVISIDEFYTAKMNKYKYACVLYDFIDHKIIDVLATRRKSYLIDYFSRISLVERAGVEVFIIDMWESYKDAIKLSFPNAKIAVDSFHVIRTLNSAIDRIRIDTMNLYKQNKSGPAYEDMYYYMLKKFSYFFLKGYEDITDKYIKIHKINRYWHKSDILNYLLSIDETLSSAYRLKERYREFNLTATYDEAADELYILIEAFRNHSHIQMRTFGQTLMKWETEIINSFMIYDDRRISNGPIESTNNKIKTIIKTANGIKKFTRLRNRIMYSINKDIPFKN